MTDWQVYDVYSKWQEYDTLLQSVSFEWSKHADLSDQVLSALKKLHADKVSLPNFDPEHNVRVTLRKDPANPDKDIKEIRLVHLDEAVLNASEETLKAEEDAFTLLVSFICSVSYMVSINMFSKNSTYNLVRSCN